MKFENQSIYSYFVGGRADVAESPLLANILDSQYDLRLKGIPNAPVYAYKAIGDEFSPISVTDELMDQYCASGANVLYERNTIGEHLSEFTNGHSRALNWLSGVFNGTIIDPSSPSCRISNVTVTDPTGPSLGQL